MPKKKRDVDPEEAQEKFFSKMFGARPKKKPKLEEPVKQEVKIPHLTPPPKIFSAGASDIEEEIIDSLIIRREMKGSEKLSNRENYRHRLKIMEMATRKCKEAVLGTIGKSVGGWTTVACVGGVFSNVLLVKLTDPPIHRRSPPNS